MSLSRRSLLQAAGCAMLPQTASAAPQAPAVVAVEPQLSLQDQFKQCAGLLFDLACKLNPEANDFMRPTWRKNETGTFVFMMGLSRVPEKLSGGAGDALGATKASLGREGNS